MPPQDHQSSEPGDFMDNSDGVESLRNGGLNDADARPVSADDVGRKSCREMIVIDGQARASGVDSSIVDPSENRPPKVPQQVAKTVEPRNPSSRKRNTANQPESSSKRRFVPTDSSSKPSSGLGLDSDEFFHTLYRKIVQNERAYNELMRLRESIFESSKVTCPQRGESRTDKKVRRVSAGCGYAVYSELDHRYNLYFRPLQHRERECSRKFTKADCRIPVPDDVIAYDNNMTTDEDATDADANTSCENSIDKQGSLGQGNETMEQWLNSYSAQVLSENKSTNENHIALETETFTETFTETYDLSSIHFSTLWRKYLKPSGWIYDSKRRIYASAPLPETVICDLDPDGTASSTVEQIEVEFCTPVEPSTTDMIEGTGVRTVGGKSEASLAVSSEIGSILPITDAECESGRTGSAVACISTPRTRRSISRLPSCSSSQCGIRTTGCSDLQEGRALKWNSSSNVWLEATPLDFLASLGKQCRSRGLTTCSIASTITESHNSLSPQGRRLYFKSSDEIYNHLNEPTTEAARILKRQVIKLMEAQRSKGSRTIVNGRSSTAKAKKLPASFGFEGEGVFCEVCFLSAEVQPAAESQASNPTGGRLGDAPLIKCSQCALLVHSDCYFDYKSCPPIDGCGYFLCQACTFLEKQKRVDHSPISSGQSIRSSSAKMKKELLPPSSIPGAWCDGRKYCNMDGGSRVFCRLCRRYDVAGGMVRAQDADWVHLACMMATRELYMRNKRVIGVPSALKNNECEVKELCKIRGIDGPVKCDICLCFEGYLVACAHEPRRLRGRNNKEKCCPKFVHPLCAELEDCVRPHDGNGANDTRYTYKCVYHSYRDNDEFKCSLCSSFDRQGDMIECDNCKKRFHATCLNSALIDISMESWFCSKCAVTCEESNLSPSGLSVGILGDIKMNDRNRPVNHVGFIDVCDAVLRQGNDYPSLELILQRSLRVLEAVSTISQLIQSQSHGDDPHVAVFNSMRLPREQRDNSHGGPTYRSVPHVASWNSDVEPFSWTPFVLARKGTYLDTFTLLLLIFQTCRDRVVSTHDRVTCCFRQSVWRLVSHALDGMHSGLAFYGSHGDVEPFTVTPCDDHQEKVVTFAGINLARLLLNEDLASECFGTRDGASDKATCLSSGREVECASASLTKSSRSKSEKSDAAMSRKHKMNKETDKVTSTKRPLPENVQLFADHFLSDGVSQSPGERRSKRRIKVVPRFQPTFGRTQSCVSLKVGEGFLCPRCGGGCAYDAKVCLGCGLSCQYFAGVGVVVCKDRDNASSPRLLDPMLRSEKVNNKEVNEKGLVNDRPEVECEVCLNLFVNISLHRRRRHDLSREEVGCPFCDKKFFSWKWRNDHVVSNHRKAQVSCHDGPQSLPNIGRQDKSDSDGMQCPLCSVTSTFASASKLSQHLDDDHSFHRMKNPKDGSWSGYELVKSQDHRSEEPRRWTTLKFGDNDERHVADILTEIEDKIKAFQTQVHESPSKSQTMEKAYRKYNTEMNRFARGLPERRRKMKCEKLTHSDEDEESCDNGSATRNDAEIPRPHFAKLPVPAYAYDDNSTDDRIFSSEENKLLNEWARLNQLKSKAKFIERYNKGLMGPVKEADSTTETT